MDEPERIEIRAREGRPADGEPIGTYAAAGPVVRVTATSRQSWQPIVPVTSTNVTSWGGGAGGSTPSRGGGGGDGTTRIESEHLGFYEYDDGGEIASVHSLASAVNSLQEGLLGNGFTDYERGERLVHPWPRTQASPAPSCTRQSGLPLGSRARDVADGRERAQLLAKGPHRRGWVSRAYWMAPAGGMAIAALAPPHRLWTPALLALAAVAAWVRQDWGWRAYRKACGCWACSASWWHHPLLRAWLLAGWVKPPKRHGHPPRSAVWWRELHDLEKDLGIEPLHDEAGNLAGDEDVEVA